MTKIKNRDGQNGIRHVQEPEDEVAGRTRVPTNQSVSLGLPLYYKIRYKIRYKISTFCNPSHVILILCEFRHMLGIDVVMYVQQMKTEQAE
jgi:hypothetical protein